jgi:hypothetical protein
LENMERTKQEWIEWANEKGFTKKDAKRALANLSGTINEIQALTAFAKFAGSELRDRQNKQGAAKGQVTKVKNENRFLYGWAVPQGWKPDEEIEELLDSENHNKPHKAA